MGFGLLAGFFWGLSFVAPKILSDYPAAWISAGRFFVFGLVSALSLALTARRRGSYFPPRMRTWVGPLLLLSLSGYSVYYLFLSAAIQRIGVTVPTLIVGLLPVTIAWVGARGRLTRQSALGLALIVLGGSTLHTQGLSHDVSADDGLGIGFALSALLLWTFYALMNVKFQSRFSDTSAGVWASVLGVGTALSSLVLLVVSNVQTSGDLTLPELGVRFWAVVGALGVLGSWVANILWNIASRRVSPVILGPLLSSEVVFGLIMGHLWVSFSDGVVALPSVSECVGITLILFGVWVCSTVRLRA